MQVVVLPWRSDAEMGTANSLHASAYYGEYNERLGLVLKKYRWKFFKEFSKLKIFYVYYFQPPSEKH